MVGVLIFTIIVLVVVFLVFMAIDYAGGDAKLSRIIKILVLVVAIIVILARTGVLPT